MSEEEGANDGCGVGSMRNEENNKKEKAINLLLGVLDAATGEELDEAEIKAELACIKDLGARQKRLMAHARSIINAERHGSTEK